MRSIVYCGADFSQWCLAEVVEPCGHAVEPRSVVVPGRAGAVLLGGEVPPKVLRVRLYWDAGVGLDAAGRAAVRHRVYAALLNASGGELVVPGDSVVTYRDAVCTGSAFRVGGTWPTWPVVTMVAAAGDGVKVADSASGKFVLVEKDFGGGESVVLDFAKETCLVDGVDASSYVALGSDFFPLKPGDVTLAFTGCSSHTVTFYERWV